MTDRISSLESTGVITPLSDAQACVGGDAVYYARAHHVLGHEIQSDVMLGTAPPEYVQEVLATVNDEFNAHMPTGERYNAAAFTIIRFCLSMHPADDNPAFQAQRMEIGPTIIVGDPDSHRVTFDPGACRQSHASRDGTRFGNDAYRQAHPIMPVRAAADPQHNELIAVHQGIAYVYVATKPGDLIFGGRPVSFSQSAPTAG